MAWVKTVKLLTISYIYLQGYLAIGMSKQVFRFCFALRT